MTKICDFPYPIYDLAKNLIPYLWADPYVNTLFRTCFKIVSLVQTNVKGIVQRGQEGKARMEGGGHDKEVDSSKFNTSMQKSIPYLWPKWRQNGQNLYPIYDQNGLKTLSFGAAHTYIAHIREYPSRVKG